jgi:small subunit ribosomal protein S20
MANHKSAKKRIKTNEKRASVNRMVRSKTRTEVKKAEKAIVAGEAVGEAIKNAEKALAKAARKGIVHRNTAARKTSRMVKKAKAAGAK